MIDRGRIELAAMLLFLQAAIGVVTIVGAIVVSIAFGSSGMGLMTLAMAVGTGFWIALGVGLLRQRRWALRATRAVQWIGVASGVIGLLLVVGTGISLVAFCTNIGLPLLVLHLVRSARPRAGAASPVPR